jgi:hypothetical protein
MIYLLLGVLIAKTLAFGWILRGLPRVGLVTILTTVALVVVGVLFFLLA